MSAGMGGGLVNGANVAGTSATNSGNNPGNSANTTNAQGQQASAITGNINNPGMYNQQNPMYVVRQFLAQHGVDPNQNSGMGEFMQRVMGAIVPVMFQNMYASGQNPDGTPKMAMDQIGNPMAMLNNIFAGNGNVGGAINSFATNALNTMKGLNPQGLSPEDTQRMMSDLSALQNFGNNTYLQHANQFGLQRRFNQYSDSQGNALEGGPAQPLSLWDYMTQNGGIPGLPPATTP